MRDGDWIIQYRLKGDTHLERIVEYADDRAEAEWRARETARALIYESSGVDVGDDEIEIVRCQPWAPYEGE